MPTTINIPNDNSQNSVPVQPVNNSFDPWGTNPTDNWGMGNQQGQNNSSQKKLTPQERVEMIEKLYEEVLGRKADTRDINYYKYSTLGEEEIRKQIITGKEHKQLLDDGREFKKMKERALTAETRVRMLESQIKDQIQEFQNLTNILQEKNRHIQQLRSDLNNPYGFKQSVSTTQSTTSTLNNTEYIKPSPAVVDSTPVVEHKKPNILDIIKDLLP